MESFRFTSILYILIMIFLSCIIQHKFQFYKHIDHFVEYAYSFNKSTDDAVKLKDCKNCIVIKDSGSPKIIKEKNLNVLFIHIPKNAGMTIRYSPMLKGKCAIAVPAIHKSEQYTHLHVF